MPKIITRSLQRKLLAREQQHAKIVYFFTGVWPSPRKKPRLATSTTLITPRSLFTCHQKGH